MRPSEYYEHVVTADEAGQRLDALLGTLPFLASRSAASRLIEDGNVVIWDVEGDDGFVPETVDTGSGSTNPMAITAIGHEAQICDMVEAINEGRPPIVDGREARKAIEIISGIYQSSNTGMPVKLPL